MFGAFLELIEGVSYIFTPKYMRNLSTNIVATTLIEVLLVIDALN